jgi:cutinase
MRFRRSRTVAITLVAAGVAALAGAVVPAGPAQAACSDVELVFARGTGEPAGLGILGAPLARGLAAALPGKSVSTYAVDYAAASNQRSAGPGATDMTNHVVATAASCANTQFVLGGYSQGASVTDIAIGIRTTLGTGSTIPTSLAGRVAAVVVFGNPLGISRQTIAGSSALYGAKAKEFCAAGDPVCGNGNNFAAHLSYARNGDLTTAAQFAASKVGPGGTQPTTEPADPTTTTTATAPADPTSTSAPTSTTRPTFPGNGNSLICRIWGRFLSAC